MGRGYSARLGERGKGGGRGDVESGGRRVGKGWSEEKRGESLMGYEHRLSRSSRSVS